MGYTVKREEPCIGCGTATKRRLDGSRVPICLDCGVVRAVKWMQVQANSKKRRIEADRRLYAKQQKARGRK